MKKFYVIANKDKDRDFVHARSICEYIEAQGCVCSYQEYEFAQNVCTYNIADIDSKKLSYILNEMIRLHHK